MLQFARQLSITVGLLATLNQPLMANNFCIGTKLVVDTMQSWKDLPGLKGFSEADVKSVVQTAIDIRPHEAGLLLAKATPALIRVSLSKEPTAGFHPELTSNQVEDALDQLALAEFPEVLRDVNAQLGPENTSLPRASFARPNSRSEVFKPSMATVKINYNVFNNIPTRNFEKTSQNAISGRQQMLTVLRVEILRALPESRQGEIDKLMTEVNDLISQTKRELDIAANQEEDAGSTTAGEYYSFSYDLGEYFKSRLIPIEFVYK